HRPVARGNAALERFAARAAAVGAQARRRRWDRAARAQPDFGVTASRSELRAAGVARVVRAARRVACGRRARARRLGLAFSGRPARAAFAARGGWKWRITRFLIVFAHLRLAARNLRANPPQEGTSTRGWGG